MFDFYSNPNTPLTKTEQILGAIMSLSPIISLVVVAFCVSGCAYKGGKVVDGTNLAIGITVPGTEWSINALDYVGGVRVAGQDSTHIIVTNEVCETNSYFGVVRTERHSKMSADIIPCKETPTDSPETE